MERKNGKNLEVILISFISCNLCPGTINVVILDKNKRKEGNKEKFRANRRQ